MLQTSGGTRVCGPRGPERDGGAERAPKPERCAVTLHRHSNAGRPRRDGLGPRGARALAPRLASHCIRPQEAVAGRDPGRWTVLEQALRSGGAFSRGGRSDAQAQRVKLATSRIPATRSQRLSPVRAPGKNTSIACWITLNLALLQLGRAALDPFPFHCCQRLFPRSASTLPR